MIHASQGGPCLAASRRYWHVHCLSDLLEKPMRMSQIFTEKAVQLRTHLTMDTFKGLVYVKHGRVGTRSEGPDYYLQTTRGDFLLRYRQRNPWEPDYHLE